MKKRILAFIVLILSVFCTLANASDYENHWAKEYIKTAISEGFLSGTANGDIEPDRHISRAEFITLLVRNLNLEVSSTFTSFDDIPQHAWYFPFISTAEEYGIAGYTDSFRPNDPITRQDCVVFACRAYNLSPISDSSHIAFSDISQISDYAKNSMFFAIKNNILHGCPDNTVKPKDFITRAETIVLLDSFKKASQSFEGTPEFEDGYPKISSEGSMNNITVDIKTTLPCTVYYKAVLADSPEAYMPPKKDEINTFLASVTSSKNELSSTILLNSYDDSYTIYFLAVAEHGTSGKIAKIKNTKALAYSIGNGTIENPYIITNESQLDYMRYAYDKHFKLGNNITLKKEWTPIEASKKTFGSLDGNGYEISNLKIKSSNDNVGLFSYINGGTVKNLAISGDIEGKNNVGLIAGKTNKTIIRDCVVTGFAKADNNAGGIVGANGGTIENSLSSLYSVEAISNAGGISGANSGYILNSISSVHSVLADMYAGGISGINNSGTIRGSVCACLNVIDFLTYNSGRITTNKEYGITEKNYGYAYMNTGSSEKALGIDSIGGEDVSWNTLLSPNFYKNTLDWDFKEHWKFSNAINKKYLLPTPKVFYDVNIEEGITPYAPIKITNISGLDSLNPDLHYILKSHINYNKEWAIDLAEFNGSFDGNGFTISGIRFSDDKNMFGKTLFGNIRNLSLDNITATGTDDISILTESNYGIIEESKITATLTASQKDTSVTVGSFCSNNFGIINNCEATSKINISGISSTIGGISANNEGFINNSAFHGELIIKSTDPNSSTSVGGISGINNAGYIYNCYAKPSFKIEAYTNYIGGICGILNSGEIFKTSSDGTILSIPKELSSSTSYTGGICGLSVDGLIFNSFSALNITSTANQNYSGGIVGYNSFANIQSTYSLNTISQYDSAFEATKKNSFIGGICGFNEMGSLSENVALNPWILSKGTLKRIANSENPEFLNNNYAYKSMLTDTDTIFDEQNGISVSLDDVKNIEFFIKPIHYGGKLGWSSTKYEENDGIWTSGKNYFLPILNGVRYQSNFVIPKDIK